ncbi:hypothetical protein L6164_025247 [Bauhinia variegata]|uniref:Uncharacterized protein n=1 Tax=Bauhinia variegata TaxID=167791 RepID=A0ACB9M333_BAUVA|nr:hypothetical protein L6164_025247 [Bauhinia variegata]
MRKLVLIAVSFMLLLIASFCLLFFLLHAGTDVTDTKLAGASFSVDSYGAKGDGQSDDSQAFLKAWNDACGSAKGTPTLFVPKGKAYLFQPVKLKGPCKPASISVQQIQGNIIAPESVDAWKWSDDDKDAWIRFSGINGLVINGGGQIDGQGASWWKCGSDGNCPRPTALHFHSCQNLQLSDLTHINSPKNHISINTCNDTHISNLHFIAPEDSPNTDGIDISASSNVFIHNCKIETGDDCVAINTGSSFINISDVACGPGHGISIGSLGEHGESAEVEEIYVRNCNFTGTQNGARIKTWEGGSGYARKITFEDITLIAPKNPIIIDQHYDPLPAATNNSAVKVSDVTYRRVYGTSAVENAIKLDCSNSVGCTNIVLEDINITSSVLGKDTYAFCNNAHGRSSSSTPNVTCLD